MWIVPSVFIRNVQRCPIGRNSVKYWSVIGLYFVCNIIFEPLFVNCVQPEEIFILGAFLKYKILSNAQSILLDNQNKLPNNVINRFTKKISDSEYNALE